MGAVLAYIAFTALIPVGIPVVFARVYAGVNGVPYPPHLLFGGGQLCFFSLTLSRWRAHVLKNLPDDLYRLDGLRRAADGQRRGDSITRFPP